MTDETTDEAIVHATTDEAMLAVMREIEVIAKTRRSEAGGNYMFRGIEELLEAIAPACRRHGLLTPTSVGAPIISTYQAGSGGRTTMNHVILPVTVHFRTPGGDVVESGGLGEAADSGDKAVSKAYSVGYREIMFKTFVIPTRGDDYDTERDDATRAGGERRDQPRVEVRRRARGDVGAVQGRLRRPDAVRRVGACARHRARGQEVDAFG